MPILDIKLADFAMNIVNAGQNDLFKKNDG